MADSGQSPGSGTNSVPRHVAIIMDGNGRWARARGRPRHFGHRAGAESVRRSIRACVARGVEVLTLFAFSSENWRRPRSEISRLMELFVSSLDSEVPALAEQGVRLHFIGDRSGFSNALRNRMADAEKRTAENRRLQLVIAVGYGGRWDIAGAARHLAERVAAGEMRVAEIDEERLAGVLQLAGVPDPDLFIRTGGERRISNFLLWNLAYTELYFTDCLWPDFDEAAFDRAIDWFAGRDRRFGRIREHDHT